LLEKLDDAPAGIDAVIANGQVSKDDFERVVAPMIDDARREHRRIRLLYEFGPRFRAFTPGAGWEDLKLGIGSRRLFEGCAIVSDARWIRESTRLMAFLMPCPVRVFGRQERHAALDWLTALPQGAGVTHHLVPGAGVIVVEVSEPLRAQDFDALAATAGTWLKTHDRLGGVVLHARSFPGWQNLGGLLRHVRFVRDHHRKTGRVALATDSRLAGLAPRLANHLVQAEVRRFGYDQLQAAVAWASVGHGQ
jgi:hypothetical protein